MLFFPQKNNHARSASAQAHPLFLSVSGAQAFLCPTILSVTALMNGPATIYTVSELNRQIRGLLEGRYPFLSVSGEISNLRRPSSGHCYFTLKDESAQLKSVLFKMQHRYLLQPLEDGKQVICHGRISVYEPRGDYQLIVDTVDFHGAGNLQAAYEQLKNKLAAEGLFDQSTKRPLPPFPRHITLVTSPNGAAIHDFLHIAARRYPLTALTIYPVTVQGPTATQEIIQAIHHINQRQEADIIVLCRGGGSIEDLWPFNAEELARTIRASSVPVVNAVGHEIDFTIADFAADLRAPTPSSAAELLLPDAQTVLRQLQSIEGSLCQALQRIRREAEHRLRYVRQRMQRMPHPLDALLLRLGHLSLSLENNFEVLIERKSYQLQTAAGKLEQQNPLIALNGKKQQLELIVQRMAHAMHILLQEKEQHYREIAGVLDAVSPLATLARGYAIARTVGPRGGRIVTDARQVRSGQPLNVQVKHGSIYCRVESTDEEG